MTYNKITYNNKLNWYVRDSVLSTYMLVKVYNKAHGVGAKDFYFVVANDVHDAEYIYSRYIHQEANFEVPEFQKTTVWVPIESNRGFYEKGRTYYQEQVSFTSIRQLIIDELLKDLNE